MLLNKKTIKKYLEFAINNWYIEIVDKIKITECKTYSGSDNIKYIWLYVHYIWLIAWTKIRIPISDIITSREFLEAIVRWLNKDNIAPYWIDEITIKQAMSIRDNKLEEFITNLLKNS